MKRRKGWIILLVFILVAALAAGALRRFSTMRQQQTASAGAQKYAVHTVSVSDIVLTVQGSGAVAAAETVTVQAPQAGTVNALKAEDGDRVKAGDVLAMLELPDLDTEIAQLRSDLDTADQNLRRLKPTNGSTAIASPVDGLVKQVHIQADDLIDPVMKAKGALMVLSVDKQMRVTLTPEARAAANVSGPDAEIRPGQSVKVAIGAKTATGRVLDVQTDGAVIVQFDDAGYDVAAEAIVRTSGGVELGRGKTAISRPFLLTATGGIVRSVSVKAGQSVDAGDTLLRLKSEVLTPAYLQALQKRDQLAADLAEKLALQKVEPVRAPADGIVSDLKLSVNDVLKKDQAICSVVDDTKIELTMSMDELDVPMIQNGQVAQITLDALPGKTFSAKVTKISAIGTYSGGVANYPVTVTFDQPAGVLAGMSANAAITVLAGSQVPVIPLAAIQTIDNRSYVLLADALNADGTLKGGTSGTSSAGATGTGANGTGGTSGTGGTTAGTSGSGSTGSTGSTGGATWRDYLVEVQIGRSTENGAEIVSGLQPGERIALATSTNGQAGGLGLGMGSGMNGFGDMPRDIRPTTVRAGTTR